MYLQTRILSYWAYGLNRVNSTLLTDTDKCSSLMGMYWENEILTLCWKLVVVLIRIFTRQRIWHEHVVTTTLGMCKIKFWDDAVHVCNVKNEWYMYEFRSVGEWLWRELATAMGLPASVHRFLSNNSLPPAT